jgi:hypothetical protein
MLRYFGGENLQQKFSWLSFLAYLKKAILLVHHFKVSIQRRIDTSLLQNRPLETCFLILLVEFE